MNYFNRPTKLSQRVGKRPFVFIQGWRYGIRRRVVVFCLRIVAGLFTVACLHGLLLQSVHSQETKLSYTCPITSTNPTDLIEQGTISYQNGQFNQALSCWQQATTAAQSINDIPKQRISQINQAQAMQALGLQLRACQTLFQTFESQASCQSLTEKDIQAITQATPSKIGITATQIGLRSLGDVLRSLGYLDLSEQVLSQLAQAQTSSLRDRSAVILSLGRTEHAFSKRYQELYNRSEDLNDAIAALQKAQIANEYYQRIINQSSHSFPAIQAQLNQLNLWLAVTAWISEVKPPSQKQVTPLTFVSVRGRDSKRECQGEQGTTNQPSNSWSTFQELVKNLNQTQPSLTTVLPQLQAQIEHYPTNTSGLYARLNFAHILTQLYSGPKGSAQVKGLETEVNLPKPGAIAQQLAEVAKTAHQQGNVQIEAYALGYLGKLYLNSPLPQLLDAQTVTLQAVTLARKTQQPALIYQWEAQLGDIYRERSAQDPSLMKSAISMYSSAIETLKSVRSDLIAVDPDVQFTFRDSVEPTYRQLISLLLQPNASEKSNAKYLALALETMDGLQKAELENFLQCSLQGIESGFSSRQLLDKPVEQPGVATIYPILLDDRIEIVVKSPDGSLHHASTPVARDTLEKTAKNLQTLLRKADSAIPSITQLTGQLYNWLIQPIEPYLDPATIKTLVFVPDSLLRNIPMSVLYHQLPGSNQGHYLIQEYAIAVSPGLNLPSSNGIDLNSLRVLVAGLTEKRLLLIKDRCTAFNELPNVKTELKDILSVLKKERISQLFNKEPGQEFTEKNFRARLESSVYPIVHLATHGKFSSNPQETFILTADGDPIYVNDLQDILKNRAGSASNGIELLVLSACETAEGDSRAALGIAGIAARSGASSTLASLWAVDDQSTAKLMQYFYTQLTNSENRQGRINKAELLRQAQLALLNEPNSRLYHPNFWAPFILVGNWQ